jgi:methanogenic corrinoid protein MtbC1
MCLKTLTLETFSNSVGLRPEKRGQVELSINSDINRPLHKTLVSHVIPQLLGTAVRSLDKLPFTADHSVALGRACISSHTSEAEALVKSLLVQGFDIESLYLDAIPEAARLFHDWWNADEIDFISVTQGIFRLEELVYSLSAEFVMGGNQQSPGSQLNALLVKPPGAHHSLGLLILSQYFRRYGWQVISANQFTSDDILGAVRSEWVDVVGLSLSEDKQVPEMKKTIVRLRQQSSNPQLRVMVGGPLLRFRDDLAVLLGADFSCLHADQAQATAWQQVKKLTTLSSVKATRR